MPLNFPFAEVDRRAAWLRLVLLISCFLGLLASWPLWLNARTFPLLSITAHFPMLPSPLDKGFFAVMLLLLVLAVRFYRPAVKAFLILSLFAFCEDQNRGQPWFYLYCVMLGLTLLPGPISLAACRCAISVVYLWSGIQKLNPRFFQVEPTWFVAPAANWHLPAIVMDLLQLAVTCTPFIELAIGLALWSGRLWRGVLAATLLIHLGAILFLGPLGYNYNWVVLPWNLAMIALVCVLFLPRKRVAGAKKNRPATAAVTFPGAIAELRSSKPALIVVACFALLPLFSYVGLWDSYFSFSLYAENSATANIFVTKAFGDRLPPKLRALVKPFPQTYDPQFQGPFIFSYGPWCYQELHVPPIPEPRAFLAIYRYLRNYSREPEDLRMIVGQRGGPVIFYEGYTHKFLTPK